MLARSMHAGGCAAIAVAALLSARAQTLGQSAIWRPGVGNMFAAQAIAAATPGDYRTGVAPRGPLARLVRNPDTIGGLPPFGLADQTGTIQRYVEPVPEVDLESYLGEVVVVRHDTGRTLLASQLELPALPLRPTAGAAETTPSDLASRDAIRPVQYTDDALTVELLDDEGAAAGAAPEEVISDPLAFPATELPLPGANLSPEAGHPGWDAPYCGPESCGTTDFAYGASGFGAAPSPYAGGFAGAGYPAGWAGGLLPMLQSNSRTRLYGQLEINFLRVHVTEEPLGKLSEKYEFSPRFILGFTDLGPLDGRARYWIYDRETRRLGGGSIRLEFDVVDLEATHYFGGRRSELLLGTGVRFAHLEFEDVSGADAGADQAGLTFAADGRTRLLRLEQGRLSWVYGGRLSILAGNWGGDDDHEFIDRRIRDDNTLTHELYVGLEYACCYDGLDLVAQAAYEMQNWRSNTLDAAGIESITLLGPGVRIGARF